LRTLVVGSGEAPYSLPRDDARVEVRGYVADVVSVLQGPAALVVPLRVGGGSRTKVLEALACGMPVVSTEIGVENLGLEPGRHYLGAETPDAMAHALVRLTRDRGLVSALGQQGSRRIDEGFRQDAVSRALEPLCRRLAGRASTAARASPSRCCSWACILFLPTNRPSAWASRSPDGAVPRRLRESGCVVETVLPRRGRRRCRQCRQGVRVLRPDEFRPARRCSACTIPSARRPWSPRADITPRASSPASHRRAAPGSTCRGTWRRRDSCVAHRPVTPACADYLAVLSVRWPSAISSPRLGPASAWRSWVSSAPAAA
jgi:hypothetical protein